MKLDSKTIQKLNKIQIHLKAFTLSDICDGSGREITRNSWEGCYEETDCRQNGAQWPLWETIDNKDVKVWKYALSMAFCQRRERMLDKKLGCWI